MALSAILTLKVIPSKEVQEHHRKQIDTLRDLQKIVKDGLWVSYDPHNDPTISKALEEGTKKAEAELKAIAKNMGLESDGNLSYGANGYGDSPIEFWYQISAK